MTKRKKAYGPEAFKYTLNNPKKYTGKLPVICRSGLEKNAIWKFDNCETIISWGSESVVIKYFNPIKNKQCRYFVDMNFTAIDQKTGREKRYLVEVKMEKETHIPTRGKKAEKTFIKEAQTYAINLAKWRAAKALCDSRGWLFCIWSESSLRIWKEGE